MLFLETYWKPILTLAIALILFAYISLLKHEIKSLRSDNASLTATIAQVKAVGDLQNAQTKQKEQTAHEVAVKTAQEFSQAAQQVKDYYASHPVIKHVVSIKPVSVCNTPTNTSGSQLPDTGASPQGTDADPADPIPARSSLEEACTLTTLQLVKLQDFERGQEAIK
jgi:hypothetical protein